MVINIPIQIHEEEMTKLIKQDYEERVIDEIVKYITKTIEEQGRGYGYSQNTRFNAGMLNIITQQVDKFLDEHKEEIIDKAGNVLAEKLRRTKRVKDAVDSVLYEYETD